MGTLQDFLRMYNPGFTVFTVFMVKKITLNLPDAATGNFFPSGGDHEIFGTRSSFSASSNTAVGDLSAAGTGGCLCLYCQRWRSESEQCSDGQPLRGFGCRAAGTPRRTFGHGSRPAIPDHHQQSPI